MNKLITIGMTLITIAASVQAVQSLSLLDKTFAGMQSNQSNAQVFKK